MNADKLCTALEEGGAIAVKLTGYERRDAQLNLVRLIANGFNKDAVVAAEAGTGVGKSFAYLLPAVGFALAHDERIVISTATITLQQQLYEKDIPLVLSALGKNIKCLLVKGRGNYLCRRRLAEAQMEPPLDSTEYEELRSLGSWALETKTGSKSDLPFFPSASLWPRLCCESDTCLGVHCDERKRCFFITLKKEAADAKLLVVNHHLLFADLAARHEGAGYESVVVLPPFTRVIIDEAHTMENSATSFFSKGWSRPGLSRSLSRLYRKRRTMETGLLLRLASLLPGLPVTPALPNEAGRTEAANKSAGKRKPAGRKKKTAAASGSALSFVPQIPKLVSAVREAAEKADEAALSLCGNEGLFRFTCRKGADPLGALRRPLEKLQKAIGDLAAHIKTMTELVNGEDSAVWEIMAIVRRLESTAELCSAFLEFGFGVNKAGEDSEVFWLEKNGSSRDDPWVTFTVTPVSIAGSLKEALFEANKTVICVSATLSIAGSFQFWAERTGASLAKREFFYGVFPSPFPYHKRTLVAVPNDAPMPDSPLWDAFICKAITGLIRLAGGSALVLFTSYQSLQKAFNGSVRELEEEGLLCLKQGDDDRTRLLQKFLENKTSVLFGTDSFWEGVDAPGETLRLLIICRLPFKTLKDPVFEARREYLENRGCNSFMELSLPDAVIKFKQGFGRLMRNSSDYGAVAVLDGRILHKYYGKAFLDSLPETRTSFRELEGILQDMELFFY